MPLYSVGDMLPSIGRKLYGSGVDSTCEPGFSQVLEMYNKINMLAMVEEDTIVTAFVTLPVFQSCITLDRRIQRIVQAKTCTGSVQLVGQSFQFLDAVSFSRYIGVSCVERMTFMGGQFPTVRDLDQPRLIFAVSDRPEDADVEMTVIGTDENRAELRTLNQGKGIKVPIIYANCEVAPNFNCGDGYHRGLVGGISMLRKPRTHGYVQVWGLDEHSGSVYWLTTMAPDETSPNLTRYQIGGNVNQMVLAEVVLQYVPLYDVNEISLIQMPVAYERMTQALHYEDAGDINSYAAYRNSALSLIRKTRAAEDGTYHQLNVAVNNMPLQGRNYSLRGSPGRGFRGR